MSDGFSILITRPRGQEPLQEVWLAHISPQAEAVVTVQAAAGELNDSKGEILNAISHSDLGQAGLEEGQVRKETAARAGSLDHKDLSETGDARFNPDAPVDLAVSQDTKNRRTQPVLHLHHLPRRVAFATIHGRLPNQLTTKTPSV